MSARRLEQCVLPIADPGLEHVTNIRIGTKALTFWPQRFTTDPDADALLRLIENLVKKGKSVFIMMHVDHPAELRPDLTRNAIARLLSAGAQLRGQAPVLRHVNDSSDVWSQLWQEEVRLGIVPYYMFVARDTGARSHYDLPLVRALEIYRGAVQKVSGLARTARGPSMSTRFGKIEIQGITQLGSERVFCLNFLQGRNPDWVKRPFFARYDEHATWFDELRPAFGESRFFFENACEEVL
jgi:L-lysine 2,3-aminomutase